jgi:hypothetical protein
MGMLVVYPLAVSGSCACEHWNLDASHSTQTTIKVSVLGEVVLPVNYILT